MADFVIRAEGLRPVERRLHGLLAKFGDLFPLMDVLGRYLVDSTRHRFETGIAPDGTPWKMSKRVEAEGGNTLLVSGQLRDSITHLPASAQVEVGTNKIYAGVHQLGATIRPVNAAALTFQLPGGLGVAHAMEVTIPARPYIGVSAADVAGLERLTERYAASAAM